jgi:hypothetical protein
MNNESKIVKQTIKTVKIECEPSKRVGNDIKSLIGNPYTMNKTIKKLKKLQKKNN